MTTPSPTTPISPAAGFSATTVFTTVPPAPTVLTTTAESRPKVLDDAELRAALDGLWLQPEGEVDDATGAFSGPDWFGLSFVPGDGSPMLVVSPCGTFGSRPHGRRTL